MLKARPQNLTLLLLLAIMVAATAVLLLVIGLLESKVAIGIFGVLVGSAISAATSIALAKANARFALRTAALEKRLKAHQEGYALWHEILERV